MDMLLIFPKKKIFFFIMTTIGKGFCWLSQNAFLYVCEKWKFSDMLFFCFRRGYCARMRRAKEFFVDGGIIIFFFFWCVWRFCCGKDGGKEKLDLGGEFK